MRNFFRTCRLAFMVLCGKIILPTSLEGIELMSDLVKTAAALAALSASADRLIAKATTDGAVAADAAAAITAADEATAAEVAAITAKIDVVVPAPAAAAQQIDPNTGLPV
jgi:hypothetical protein